MRSRILLVLGLLLAPLALADTTRVLDAELWSRPRSIEIITNVAPLRDIVRGWLAAPTSTIQISHADREEPELWALELRDWLIASGIPGDRILVDANNDRDDQLRLRLSKSAR